MLGAIIGDIVGSRFEWNNCRSKDFEFFAENCFPTDDSIMTLAIGKALLESRDDFSDLSALAVKYMQELGNIYPFAGYGGRFSGWLIADRPEPYNSFGNGSAMRVSGVAFAAKDEHYVKFLSRKVTAVTHDHPEGLKGAEAVALATYLARTGKSLQEIKDRIERDYYTLDFTLDEIRETYRFNETCQGSVPQALEAVFESTDFEDAIRNAISIGGDSDTIAAMAGAVAAAHYGIPPEIRERAVGFLDERLAGLLAEFEERCGRE